MRIPRASFYVRALAFVATGWFAAAVCASPVPQAAAGVAVPQSKLATAAIASTNSGTNSVTNSGTAGHHPRRAFRVVPKAKSAAKVLPDVAGDPLLVATSTTNHLETILDPGFPTFYLQSFEKVMVGSSAVVQTDTLMNSSKDCRDRRAHV